MLGVGIASDGCSRAQEAHREKLAQRMWFGSRNLLQDRSFPLRLRVEQFAETCEACLLYGAGAWSLNNRLRKWAESWEARHLRWMVNDRRDGRPWLPWLRSTAEAGHAARRAAGLQPLWVRILQLHHGYHGHVARQRVPHCPAACVLHWRSPSWWRSLQALAGSSHKNLGEWRHPVSGWKRDTQCTLVEHYGVEWPALALDREAWRNGRQEFVSALRRI